MRHWLVLFGSFISFAASLAQAPSPDGFRVLPPTTTEGPAITPYLKYQTEMAWDQDEQRRNLWSGIRSEQDLLRVQEEIHQSLLSMLGGLPAQRSPLHPQITGRVKMDGFHIEK